MEHSSSSRMVKSFQFILVSIIVITSSSEKSRTMKFSQGVSVTPAMHQTPLFKSFGNSAGVTEEIPSRRIVNESGQVLALNSTHDLAHSQQDNRILSTTTDSSTLTEQPYLSNVSDYAYGDANDTEYYYYYDDDYDADDDVLRQISFTKTLYFCEYLYSAMYGEYTSFPDSGIVYNNQSVTVIYEDKFLNVCIPLYDVFNDNCTVERKFSFCPDESVLFLNNHGCTRPSTQDIHFEHLLAATLMEYDDECFQSVCNGHTRVVDSDINGIHIRLFNPIQSHVNESCVRYFRHYYSMNNSKNVYRSSNVYWPCCYPGYTILWSEDPKQHGLVTSWSYLPISCRVAESIFITFIVFIIVFGVISNVTVIVILLGSRSVSEGSNLTHFSLALSNLMISLFVLAPALHIQLMLIYGYASESNIFNSVQEINPFHESDFEHQTSTMTVSSGYYLFSAIVLGSCTINSLLMSFTLSFERFVASAELTSIEEHFTPTARKIYIVSAWFLGLILSLGLMSSDHGISTEWSSFSKLPTGVSTQRKRDALPIIMVILGTTCISTLVFMNLTAYHYWRLGNQKPQTEHTEHERRGHQANTKVTQRMVHMIIFFLSNASAGLATIIRMTDANFYHSELVYSSYWWIFLASTAWTPWLHSLSNQQFRKSAVEIKYSILAVFWGRSWVPSEDNSNPSKKDSERDDPEVTSSQESSIRRRTRVASERVSPYEEESV